MPVDVANVFPSEGMDSFLEAEKERSINVLKNKVIL